MKVVLFCGGLGTRIREYSESIPKPMVPVGHQPIMCHVMQYYSQYGHDDFILCLGYKANVIKDYFLNYRQTANSDCVISEFGKKVEILGDRPPDWRVSLVDTGTWRNIGERLMAVKHLVKDEEIFLANYSDGLTDAPLPEMIEKFKASGKIGCFIAIHPPISFHLTEFDDEGSVQRIRSSQESDIWINGGFFIFRKEIFDFIKDGEELVLEPFNRLIEGGHLMAYKYEGFWRAMDTLRTAFDLPVGLSDHSLGIAIPIAAAARGARVIEKHITLDRNLPGPDHRASLEPTELKAMVAAIRQVERALGTGLKLPRAEELRNVKTARKSIVAARDIARGERYSIRNLTAKRAGSGRSPLEFWELLGRRAPRRFRKDEPVE